MKKVLSFVLSVAMVICLAPSLAFAADDDAASTTTATATGLSQFSDKDSIRNENKAAVAVLVGLGIIDGMGDGTFQPKGDLTRAQASKLIATLVKQGDKSDIAAPAVDPFTDVKKDYWGAGAIQFGVDNGYINGMGDGTFHPEDQVTTAQLATMLCKLLGYSVEDVNYHWPENAMGYANNAGLLIDVNKGATDVLNREEAAQMIYNALLEDTVMKSSVSGSDSHDVRGETGYSPVRNKLSQDYRRNSYARDTIQQLIEKYFPNAAYVENTDAFGRPSTVWKNGKDNMTDENTKAPVFTYDSRQVTSLTDKWPKGVATDQLKKDIDGYIADEATVTINGELQLEPRVDANGNVVLDRNGNIIYTDDPVFISDDFSEYLANKIAPYTGNGVRVELYANERDTHIDKIIVIDYDVDVVKNVNSFTGDITLDKNGVIDKKEDFYSTISVVGKNDVVLIAKNSSGEIIDVYLPTEVNDAAVSNITYTSKAGREDATATVGGKVYTIGHDGVAKIDNHGLAGYALNVDAADEGTAFLDKYGYLVAYRSVKLPDWALLTSVYLVEGKNDVGEPNNEMYGILIKEDGTKISVPLLYIDDPTAAGYSTDKATNTRNAIEAIKKGDPDGPDGNNWFLPGGILVNYKESASGYILSTYESKSAGIEAPKTELNDKTSRIDDTYYLANEISVVRVNGDKASKLTTSKSSSITQTYAPSSYKYVVKKIGDNRQVTTIYVIDEVYHNDKSAVVKVVKSLGESVDGTTVRYYTDDSTEPKEILVSNEEVAPGYYYVDAIESGMYLDRNKATNVVDRIITVGNEDSATITRFGSGMTLNKVDYKLSSNATVVDLRTEGGIDKIEDLVDSINEIGSASSTDDTIDPMRISFSYDIDDAGVMTVNQVYIEKIESTN